MDSSKTIELLSTLMLENMSLRKEIETLKSKKVKEVDPNKSKKKYGKLDEETLAIKRRDNGLRLAAWRKSKKESETSEASKKESETSEASENEFEIQLVESED